MASSTLTKAVILGATGPTGIHLAAALRRKGLSLRVVSRSRRNLERLFSADAAEIAAADVTDAGATLQAVAGCDLVFACIGLPPEQMHLHPVIARNVAAAVKETGARCVQISSYWAYLPAVQLPLDELHPRTGGGDWIHRRREAEDILGQAGAAVINLPDFYGPHVSFSSLQQPLREAAQGKTLNWIGGADTAHEYVFVPDAMAVAAELAFRAEAYGGRWIVPGAGPVTGREVAAIAGRILGRRVALHAAGKTLLRVASLFKRDLRLFMPMVPDYLKPITYDGAKLRNLLPGLVATRYEDGIRRTLDWLAAVPPGT